ncbi:MAG: hypothetical protein Q7U04_15205 [Bacteriovorax sp.]|nr:hypothetical protein [Bacteriovorax sp.]
MNKFILFYIFLLPQFVLSEELKNTLIKFKYNSDKERILEIVKLSGAKVQSQGEKFILIAPSMTPKKMSNSNWENLLLRLKNIDNVISIGPDKKMIPLDTDLNPTVNCGVSSPEVKIDGVKNLSNVLDKVKAQNVCSLSEKCNEQSLSWGPQSIGADLADGIISREIEKVKELQFIKCNRRILNSSGINRKETFYLTWKSCELCRMIVSRKI